MSAASSTNGVGASAEVSGSEFSVTDASARDNVVVKIGMVGDAGVGQTFAARRCCRAPRDDPRRQNKFNGEVC